MKGLVRGKADYFKPFLIKNVIVTVYFIDEIEDTNVTFFIINFEKEAVVKIILKDENCITKAEETVQT